MDGVARLGVSKCFKIRRPRPKPAGLPYRRRTSTGHPRSSPGFRGAGSEDSSSGLAKEPFIDFQRTGEKDRLEFGGRPDAGLVGWRGEFSIAEFCRARKQVAATAERFA